ncbi:hypothetical protein R3W88_032371 [Solanum pinnatisectum]|uniref:Disease resistance protein winged helix domain-containing protein n=1 Tax=Solanum pinnatisectum TaxID=50273 RepID=A0AAV9LQV4_9SOLN|nr:hypothetical protein R3W88_032371 [Solanum pinnatisectum]
MRVLALSYHHLPRHLNPCFLYFAIFPEDEVIFVDKLKRPKSVGEVTEKCLKELIDRSLISIHNLSFDGKIKSCGMHDVTHELCLREARNMNFVNVIKRNNDQNPCEQEPMHFSSKSRGRISIQFNPMFYNIIAEKLARCGNIDVHSIFLLVELQDCKGTRSCFNEMLWHLYLGWNYLRYHEPTEKRLVLKNLQSLSGWNPSAQMKTMELMENPLPEDVVPDLILLPPYAFPQNLKKLAFSSTTLQWKDLSILSKLPKLEALKLVHNACKGEEWEVVEGFPHLKFLRASCDQFPCPERLFLERCVALDSIPQDYTCSN